MKYLVTCMVVVLFLLGCSLGGGHRTNHNDSVSEDEAIAQVILETQRIEFPTKRDKVKGIIQGGGPAPGLRIPGEFESAAMREDEDTFIVILTEYWSSDIFRNENSPAHATLTHYWKYKVTDGKVEILEDDGDFSPEFVE
ncbi:hypothetical protein ACP8HI_00595 [Paenibacillus sp. FA6]|uniref:hypothetical protein n=1 Tax=Paenibacillus sp. FA6 TaxID=3413029 RepID=UPI003F65F899